jgi:D-amino-acid dehydrogenase
VLRFMVASRNGPMRRAIPLLRDLHTASAKLYAELAARRDLTFDYAQKGMLSAYTTAQGLHHGEAEVKLLAEFGVPAQMLDAAAAHQKEPALHERVVGGVFFPNDGHFNPSKFVQGLAESAEKRGVRIQRNTEILHIQAGGNEIKSVLTTSCTFY